MQGVTAEGYTHARTHAHNRICSHLHFPGNRIQRPPLPKPDHAHNNKTFAFKSIALNASLPTVITAVESLQGGAR